VAQPGRAYKKLAQLHGIYLQKAGGQGFKSPLGLNEIPAQGSRIQITPPAHIYRKPSKNEHFYGFPIKAILLFKKSK